MLTTCEKHNRQRADYGFFPTTSENPPLDCACECLGSQTHRNRDVNFMYSLERETAEGVIALKISGRLSKREYVGICALLREAIGRHEHVDLLWELVDFRGWKLFAFWEAAKVATAGEINLRRVAVVGDKQWHSWTRPLVRGFHADTRYFAGTERAPALRWLLYGGPTTAGRKIGRVRAFDKPKELQSTANNPKQRN